MLSAYVSGPGIVRLGIHADRPRSLHFIQSVLLLPTSSHYKAKNAKYVNKRYNAYMHTFLLARDAYLLFIERAIATWVRIPFRSPSGNRRTPCGGGGGRRRAPIHHHHVQIQIRAGAIERGWIRGRRDALKCIHCIRVRVEFPNGVDDAEDSACGGAVEFAHKCVCGGGHLGTRSRGRS